MTHDDRADALLSALAGAARDEDAPPPEWEAMAAGTLDPQGRMALRAAGVDDPQLRDALSMLDPPGDEADDALADALLASLGFEAEVSTTPSVEPPAQTTATRGRARWGVIVGGAVLALAAALVVGLGIGQRAALPDYQFEFSAGERTMRGSADAAPAAPKLYPDSRIALTMRPATAVEGPVAVAAFAKLDGAIKPIDPKVTCGGVGACKLEAIVGDLLPQAVGSATLVFVIGPPDALPEGEAAFGEASDQVRRFEQAVELVRD